MKAPHKIASVIAAGLLGIALGGLVWLTAARATGAQRDARATQNGTCAGGGPGNLASASVPSFQPSGSIAERVTAVGDRHFDPAKIVRVMSTNGMTARDLFDQEPRDLVWAPKLEGFLNSAVERDLAQIPGVKSVSVECHTSTCKISWKSEAEQLHRIKEIIGTLYLGSAGIAKDNDLVIVLGGGILRGIPVGDADRLIEKLKEMRAANLKGMHRRAAVEKTSARDLPEI